MPISPEVTVDAREDRAAPTEPPLLVVDDDPAEAAATAAALASGGYTAVTEASGDAALRLVRTSHVSVVIAELYVACADARCVVAALKRDRARLPRLRLLVHSRHTAPADIAWALDAGGDAVVPKPARPGILLREVRRLEGVVGAVA